MYTEDAEDVAVDGISAVLIDGRFFLPLAGVPDISSDDDEMPGTTDGSSNCPAGVRSKPPSGLKVSLRKKLVKLSSPYNFTEAHALADDGRARIAGRAGIGDGERPYLLKVEGELGAFDPLNDERREEGLSMGGGGNIDADGVLATDVAGVNGASPTSSFKSIADSASLAVDSLRNILGRLELWPWALGVRLCRCGMRAFFPIA